MRDSELYRYLKKLELILQITRVEERNPCHKHLKTPEVSEGSKEKWKWPMSPVCSPNLSPLHLQLQLQLQDLFPLHFYVFSITLLFTIWS